MISTNLSTVCAELLWRSTFTSIFAILPDVRSEFSRVLSDLAMVRPDLAAVGANFFAIGP